MTREENEENNTNLLTRLLANKDTCPFCAYPIPKIPKGQAEGKEMARSWNGTKTEIPGALASQSKSSIPEALAYQSKRKKAKFSYYWHGTRFLTVSRKEDPVESALGAIELLVSPACFHSKSLARRESSSIWLYASLQLYERERHAYIFLQALLGLDSSLFSNFLALARRSMIF